MNDNKILTLENISITFNPGTPDENPALTNINLSVNKGDFITVIGSNGAGKSTLYNIISGNLQPTTGSIKLNNQDITKLPEYKRAQYFGRIFQNPLLGTAGKMYLADNMMICSKKGWKGLKISLTKQRREEFKEELKKLNMGLENRLIDNVSQFSGGQRQALTLLMTVMSKPQILLLDEHTAALDPTNADIVMKLTKEFAEKYNLTVMRVTHNMQHALDYGNRLLMMDAGEIILDIAGEEKHNLTMNDLSTKFKAIRKHGIVSDKMMLS